MTDAAAPGAGARPGATRELPELFVLSPEQRDLAGTLKTYLARHYDHDELRQALAEDESANQARWRRLSGELGLSAALVPADSGGLGFGAIEAMVIAQELGRVLYRGPWLASCVLAGTALAAAGGTEAAGLL